VVTTEGLIAALEEAASAALPPAVLRLLGPGKTPPPSGDELEAFEAELGTALPEGYRQFLLRPPGGSLDGSRTALRARQRPSAFASWADSGEGTRSGPHGAATRGRRPASRALLWIMDDPGGKAVCLGLSGRHRGRVYFRDHDEETDPGAWDGEVETAGYHEEVEDLIEGVTCPSHL
jgi:hypothetical protein